MNFRAERAPRPSRRCVCSRRIKMALTKFSEALNLHLQSMNPATQLNSKRYRHEGVRGWTFFVGGGLQAG